MSDSPAAYDQERNVRNNIREICDTEDEALIREVMVPLGLGKGWNHEEQRPGRDGKPNQKTRK
jgi:hypothetical protein